MQSSVIAMLSARFIGPVLTVPLLVGSMFAGLMFFSPASATDKPEASASAALPGVDTGYRIVKPLVPDDEVEPADTGYFRIGDMDVRVSGSITVDVGVGSLRTPRR